MHVFNVHKVWNHRVFHRIHRIEKTKQLRILSFQKNYSLIENVIRVKDINLTTQNKFYSSSQLK